MKFLYEGCSGLMQSPELLSRIVPSDQDFENNYAGNFRIFILVNYNLNLSPKKGYSIFDFGYLVNGRMLLLMIGYLIGLMVNWFLALINKIQMNIGAVYL